MDRKWLTAYDFGKFNQIHVYLNEITSLYTSQIPRQN